jgi:hypothetical protein
VRELQGIERFEGVRPKSSADDERVEGIEMQGRWPRWAVSDLLVV